jgi:hypothetical protein
MRSNEASGILIPDVVGLRLSASGMRPQLGNLEFLTRFLGVNLLANFGMKLFHPLD